MKFISFIKKLKMKHWIAIALIVVLLAAGIPIFMYLVPVPLKWEADKVNKQSTNVVYVEGEEAYPYLYKQAAGGGFSGEDLKITVFTDLHLEQQFASYSKNNLTIEMLKKNIETEKPDLVIFTGDIVTSIFTKNRVVGVAELMESYGIYWAPVFGNHDGEHNKALSRAEITEIWSTYDHCLIKKGDTYGYGNYIVNIKTSATAVSQSLIFMDSNLYMSDADKAKYGIEGDSYDFIKPEQIDWYKNNLNAIKAQYGSVPSLLFMHIPIPEFKDAYENGTKVYGEKHEGVACSAYNSGMFSVIKELASTKAIFSGHDHINDYNYLHEGVNFIYVQKSGYASYDLYTKDMVDSKEGRRQGCTVVTLKADGTFTVEPKLNTRF